MIDSGNQGAFQQLGLTVRRQLPADHQPYHLRKGDIPNQIFDGMTAKTDHTGLHVDDGSCPPIGDIAVLGCQIGHITPSLRSDANSCAPIPNSA
ncbi:hypothetical protein MnTg02_02839 [bacterium MnTg02]|nr:hypothetical protein MnTg02_02839 [bacterium MnTg02]